MTGSREALYKTLAVMVGASVCIATLVLIFRVQLMSLFLDAGESAEAIGIGCTYLTIIGVAYVIAGVMQSYQNVIRGAGDVNTCMVAGLTELSGRIVFAYLLSGTLGVTGIWIGHSSVLELWLCDSGDPVLFRQMEAQEAGLMTGVAGTQRGYSGRIHPANSRMDWFSAFFSLCCICLRYSLGDICISLIK